MENTTHRETRWRGSIDRSVYEPEVTREVITKPSKEKPARLSKRQLGPVVALLERVALGGDATTAVDAASLLPTLRNAIATAPPGQPRHRKHYVVEQANGSAVRVPGVAEAARLAGKAHSTLANALSQGKGRAEFAAVDEHGNPATIVVYRDA